MLSLFSTWFEYLMVYEVCLYKLLLSNVLREYFEFKMKFLHILEDSSIVSIRMKLTFTAAEELITD